jgi:hypothetical protein
MKSAWLRGLLVLGVVAAFATTTAWPQSLAELAEKEKKRRKGTVGKVYTNDDLGSDRGGPSNLSQPGGAEAAPASAGPARVYAPGSGGETEGEAPRGSGRESEGETEGEGRGEGEAEGADAGSVPTPRDAESWRQRVEQQQRLIESAATRTRQLEGQLVALEQDVQPPGGDVLDPQRLQNREGQKAELRQQLDEAREALEKARSGLGEIEDQARRAGIPPGWLR